MTHKIILDYAKSLYTCKSCCKHLWCNTCTQGVYIPIRIHLNENLNKIFFFKKESSLTDFVLIKMMTLLILRDLLLGTYFKLIPGPHITFNFKILINLALIHFLLEQVMLFHITDVFSTSQPTKLLFVTHIDCPKLPHILSVSHS